MMISPQSVLRKAFSRWLGTSAVAAMLVLPTPTFGQNRFPTFGLPSSAYGNPVVKSTAGSEGVAPRSLSPAQTQGARLVRGNQSTSLIRPVAHSEVPSTSSPQQPSAVQRELQKLYEQNGGEMPPMNIPPGAYQQQPPVQQTATGSNVKRSVVDLMKREDVRYNTVQQQSSVRPEAAAQPPQNPPRTAPAASPTGGRSTSGGVLSGLFNWGGRSTRTAEPTAPPQEPSPYQPPTYKLQPPAYVPPAQQPQRAPSTAKTTAPKQTPVNPKPATPQLSRTPAPQPPATTGESVKPKSFQLMPLEEKTIARPSRDDFFPDDVAETTPPSEETTKVVIAPQPKTAPTELAETPQDIPESTPEVVPQTRNYAKELGIVRRSEEPIVEETPEETTPQTATTAQNDNPFDMDNLFPEDEAESSPAEDIDSFQLPRTVPDTPPSVEIANDPPSSPYTGRKLEAGVYDPAVEEPGELAGTMPNEPAHFFPADEHAIKSNDQLDINVRRTPDTHVADHVARALSQSDPSTHLEGTRMQQIAARDGIGLKGFCPVALRDRRALEDGKAAYISFFHSKAYYFSSAEAKAAFDDHPEGYAPAAQGNDVTLMALTGEVLDGSLDHAVWYKDRLYLFSTDENMKTFMAAPSAMAVNE
ncbi:MAG: hypothetical protein KDA86_11485 [Planctomycetaceae bacterium]|nr:hypothetical protein [Planctomycetaceae bacterium]